jgi:hypothetical protein
VDLATAGAVAAGVASCAMIIAPRAAATDFNFNAATGDWGAAANWQPQGVPGALSSADTASITNGGSVVITANQSAIARLTLDAASTLTFQTGPASLTVSDIERVGVIGSASITQSNGAHLISGTNGLVLGDTASGAGTYTITAGTFTSAANLFVGNSGRGVFNQSGGTVNLPFNDAISSFWVGNNAGSSGTVNLSGGTMNALNDVVLGQAGSGVFNQTGGSATLSALVIAESPGASGTFNLSGAATLVINSNTYIGYGSATTAVFNQSGGTNTFTNLEFIGYDGVGTYNQSNGTHAGLYLHLGHFADGTGSYNLSGGSLILSGDLRVGFSGNGTFTQSGGTTTINGNNVFTPYGLHLGDGGSGTYSLLGGVLTVSNGEVIGNSGAGVFSQSGGTHTIQGTLAIALGAGSTGTVNLSGGSLSAAATVNNGSFNQTGGLANLGPLSGTGALLVGNSVGALAVANVTHFAQNSVEVRNTGTLTVAPNPQQHFTNTAGTLLISGNGRIDLANHDLLVTSTPATTVRNYLANAYTANQDWSGPGLTSSYAVSNPTKYSVGYASGSDQSAQDAGINVAPGQTLVRPTLTGDTNLDGKVDFFDIVQVLGYKYNTGQQASYTDGDLNYDGKVNFFDLVTLLSANYNTGQTFPAAASAEPSAAAPAIAVPEPSSVLIACGTAGLLLFKSRRRRHRSLT